MLRRLSPRLVSYNYRHGPRHGVTMPSIPQMSSPRPNSPLKLTLLVDPRQPQQIATHPLHRPCSAYQAGSFHQTCRWSFVIDARVHSCRFTPLQRAHLSSARTSPAYLPSDRQALEMFLFTPAVNQLPLTVAYPTDRGKEANKQRNMRPHYMWNTSRTLHAPRHRVNPCRRCPCPQLSMTTTIDWPCLTLHRTIIHRLP